MTDQNYGIVVEDKIAPSIPDKLERIRSGAVGANDAVERLRIAVASLDGRALDQMSAASARWQRANDASALSAQRLATETQRTNTAAAGAASAQARLATATNGTQTAAQRLATAQAQTATATNNAAAAATRAATAQLNQQRAALSLQRAQQGATNALQNYVRSAIQLAAVGLSARAILGAADAYTTLQNKLQVVASSQARVNELTQQLFEVANRTRAPIEETATAFARFDRALIGLGRSQDESVRLTETVNKMLVISGSTAGEAGAALLQLSQAFNKGKLDGDEFRTVMELMPSAADAIAKELGVTRGELLKLAPQGKITAEVMANAFSKAAIDVDATFGKTIPTLSQSVTVFRNNFIKAIGQFDQATGITRALSAALIGLSNNFDVLGVALASVGAGALVFFGPRLIGAIGGVGGALRALFVLVAANPLVLLAAVLAGLITYLVTFKDKSDLAKESIDNIGFALDAIAGTFRGIGIFLGNFVAQSVVTVSNLVKTAYNNVVGFVEDTINFVIKGVNILREKIGKEPIELVNFERLQTQDKEFESLGSMWASSLEEGFDKQGGAIAKFLKGDAKLAEASTANRKKPPVNEELSKEAERRAAALAKVNLQLDNELARMNQLQPVRDASARFDQIEETLAGKKIKLDSDEAQAIRAKIDAVVKFQAVQTQLDRIYEEAVGPARDYNATIQAAESLLNRGAISQEQYRRAVFGAAQTYQDATDTLRAVNKEIDDQNKLLGFVGPTLEVEQRLQQIVNDQLSKNVVLTQAQIEAYRQKLTTQQRAMQQQQAESELYDETAGAAQRYIDKLDAISKAQAKGTITAGQATQQTIAANPDLNFELTQTGIDAHLQQYEDMYARIDELRNKQLINEQTAAALRTQVWAQQQEQQLKGASDFFGYLSQLSKSENSKIARIGRAAAITKAVIDTYSAANSAYAAMAGIPYIGPALGIAAAAAAVVAGLANVNAIRSQGTEGFMTGGYTGNIPKTSVAGQVHGQEYVMDAASTKRIGVANLNAMRSGAASVNQSAPPNWAAIAQAPAPVTINQRQVNVLDKSIVGDYINSPEGEDVFINVIARNADKLRSVVS